MTNNFKLIGEYISRFKKDDDIFFHISVMIRHKDVEWFPNGKDNNSRTIYSVNVSSCEELYDLEKDEHQEDKKHKEIYKKTILKLSEEYGIDKDDILNIVDDISLDIENNNELERVK